MELLNDVHLSIRFLATFSLSKYGMEISVKLNEELVFREELKRFEIVADIDLVSDF